MPFLKNIGRSSKVHVKLSKPKESEEQQNKVHQKYFDQPFDSSFKKMTHRHLNIYLNKKY